MKYLIVILLFVPLSAFSQDDQPESHMLTGVSLSLGFFNHPLDINSVIDSYLDAEDMIEKKGESDLFVNFGGRMFLGYKAKNNFGIEAFTEVVIAPKLIMSDYGSHMVLFNRISPGIKLTYDIRLNSSNSLILGAGPMYNRMKFVIDGEKTKAASWGTKFELAYQLTILDIAPRAFIDVDFAKASKNGIEMDYSGIQFGLAFSGLW
jgi:hypothetical protein